MVSVLLKIFMNLCQIISNTAGLVFFNAAGKINVPIDFHTTEKAGKQFFNSILTYPTPLIVSSPVQTSSYIPSERA
jgi:hypothetical protein